MNGTQHKLALVLAGFLFANCSPKVGTYMDIGMKTGVYNDPSWSLDGKTIVVQFRPNGDLESQLVQISEEGNEWKELSDTSSSLGPSINPLWIDEDIIVFVHSSVDSNALAFSSEIVFLDLKTHKEDVKPLPAYISEMSLNLATRRIALAYEHEIGFYEIESESMGVLVQNPKGRVEHIDYAPSGEKLAYTVAEDQNNLRYFTLIVYDIQQDKQTVLIDHTVSPIESLSWSPDGQWIALRQVQKEEGYQSGIMLIRPDGSERKTINLDFSPPADIRWSPIGNEMAITTVGQPGQNSLYLVDLTPWLKDSANTP